MKASRKTNAIIRKCQDSDDDQMAALFGMHALLTLGTRTLDRCAEVAHALDTGFHVHAAEDEIDVTTTMDRYGRGVMDRFLDFGIPGSKTIFVHGVHFESRELDLLRSTDSMLVNNPESNMNNGLGVAPILDMLKHGVLVGVGTDGMSSHLISQARAMYLHQRTYHRDPTVAFGEACEILLKNNREICNRLFREPRGMLATGPAGRHHHSRLRAFHPAERGDVLRAPAVRAELYAGSHDDLARRGHR